MSFPEKRKMAAKDLDASAVYRMHFHCHRNEVTFCESQSIRDFDSCKTETVLGLDGKLDLYPKHL